MRRFHRSGLPTVALLLLATVPLRAAEEPSGCDKFKWDITRERAALTAPDRLAVSSGGDVASVPATA